MEEKNKTCPRYQVLTDIEGMNDTPKMTNQIYMQTNHKIIPYFDHRFISNCIFQSRFILYKQLKEEKLSLINYKYKNDKIAIEIFDMNRNSKQKGVFDSKIVNIIKNIEKKSDMTIVLYDEKTEEVHFVLIDKCELETLCLYKNNELEKVYKETKIIVTLHQRYYKFILPEIHIMTQQKNIIIWGIGVVDSKTIYEKELSEILSGKVKKDVLCIEKIESHKKINIMNFDIKICKESKKTDKNNEIRYLNVKYDTLNLSLSNKGYLEFTKKFLIDFSRYHKLHYIMVEVKLFVSHILDFINSGFYLNLSGVEYNIDMIKKINFQNLETEYDSKCSFKLFPTSFIFDFSHNSPFKDIISGSTICSNQKNLEKSFVYMYYPINKGIVTFEKSGK